MAATTSLPRETAWRAASAKLLCCGTSLYALGCGEGDLAFEQMVRADYRGCLGAVSRFLSFRCHDAV